MEKFEKIVTEDGTISFYNREFDDIYHSRIGAYTEALEKFVKPSRILERLGNYSHINVFDVCFGAGYNSKVLTSSILNQEPTKKISLTAVEIDPFIIKASCEINFPGYEDNLKSFFDGFLHKVYYTTISNRHSEGHFFETSWNNITFKIFIDDARQAVQKLNETYDIILLDPFCPKKFPVLWTVDFFKHLHRLLNNSGMVLTYSSAHSVRGAFVDAGFSIGNTIPVGRDTPGTIAVKDKTLIEYSLTLEQDCFLKSKAGIPFEDPELSWSSEEIYRDRELKQKDSDRISASSIRKSCLKSTMPSE